MQKKKFDLTSDIVHVDLNEESKINKNSSVTPTSIPPKNVLITLAVTDDIRKEYKSWCAKNGLKMNEAFLEGFHLLKRHLK